MRVAMNCQRNDVPNFKANIYSKINMPCIEGTCPRCIEELKRFFVQSAQEKGLIKPEEIQETFTKTSAFYDELELLIIDKQTSLPQLTETGDDINILRRFFGMIKQDPNTEELDLGIDMDKKCPAKNFRLLA